MRKQLVGRANGTFRMIVVKNNRSVAVDYLVDGRRAESQGFRAIDLSCRKSSPCDQQGGDDRNRLGWAIYLG